jgi:hypothetical protein
MVAYLLAEVAIRLFITAFLQALDNITNNHLVL